MTKKNNYDILILGHKYRIVEEVCASDSGTCDTDTKTIMLNKKDTLANKRATLFHELCHAALHVGGVSFVLTDEVEEAVVRAIEHGVYPLIEQIVNYKEKES